MDEYSFVKSQKGKEKLVFREHIYRHQRSREQNHYFRCEDKNCGGAATLRGVSVFNAQGGLISEGKTHNHAPLAGRNEVLKSIDELKGQAKTTNATPSAIIQETRQKLDINYAVEMPSTSAMRQAIHRIRKKEFPVEANSAIDLVIPNKLKVTHTGERIFLLFDTKTENVTLDAEIEEEEVQERIIAFGSENNLRRLADSNIWFLDGTFKTCPQLFYQIYTIHYIFHGQTLPAVYVLLPGKTTQIYSSMLENLISAAEAKGIQLIPTFIMVDFELSCIKALQEKFPEDRISGCFFHLCQNIYRSIQKYGLVDAYKNHENLALCLRQLAALAFLQPHEIHDAYLSLSNNIPDQAEPVYKYFGETYVLGRRIISRRGRPRQNQVCYPPRFHPTIWSIHHLHTSNIPRTNNGVEAWHRRFETVVERYHVGVYSMIREFVKEDHRTDQEVQRLTSGINPIKKKEQIQRENRLATVLSREGQVSLNEYIRGIAHNLLFGSSNRPNNLEEDINEG